VTVKKSTNLDLQTLSKNRESLAFTAKSKVDGLRKKENKPRDATRTPALCPLYVAVVVIFVGKSRADGVNKSTDGTLRDGEAF
jgi:hypothetical protein